MNRMVCYEDKCIEEQKHRKNLRRSEQRRQAKAAGPKVIPKQDTNGCLKCGIRVRKPGWICGPCKTENLELSREFDAAALGIGERPFIEAAWQMSLRYFLPPREMGG